MNTWMLAARNLLRNRRRSLATLLALAIGSASILLFGGFRAYIEYSMLTGYVRAGGHLQVQHRDFFLYGNGNPTAYGITDHPGLMRSILDDPVMKPMVKVVTPMLVFGGIGGNYDAGVSRTVFGTGLVAADITRMRAWDEFLVRNPAPPFALDGATPDAAIVGVGVARVLLLCAELGIPNCPQPQAATQSANAAALPADVAELAGNLGDAKTPREPRQGATLELLAGQSRGTPNVAALRVLTAEDQGFKELDEVAVLVHFAQAQQLIFGKAPAKATALMIQLAHTEQIGPAIERLQTLLAKFSPRQPLAVMDFKALNPFYVQTLDLFNMIFGFIFVLIGGIVLFTVSNTMNTAVVERTVEIGTLRAIGLRQAGIRRLFITEGFLIGCIGAVTGCVVALVLSGAINLVGLTWRPPGSSELLPLMLRVWGEHAMLVGTTFGLILIGTLSAWWPAWRASDLKIVDALRHA